MNLMWRVEHGAYLSLVQRAVLAGQPLYAALHHHAPAAVRQYRQQHGASSCGEREPWCSVLCCVIVRRAVRLLDGLAGSSVAEAFPGARLLGCSEASCEHD